jgi:hypothetical protein
LTTHLRVLPSYKNERSGGAVSLLPIYAFKEWIGTTLPFKFNFVRVYKTVLLHAFMNLK